MKQTLFALLALAAVSATAREVVKSEPRSITVTGNSTPGIPASPAMCSVSAAVSLSMPSSRLTFELVD